MDSEITKEDYKYILKSMSDSEKTINKLFLFFITNGIALIGYFGNKFLENGDMQFLDLGTNILITFVLFMMFASFIIINSFNKQKQKRERLKEKLIKFDE